MRTEIPTNVVIAGGGTSGWLAASAISKLLGKTVKVSLIESSEIGRIGVGEATIPSIREFHRLLNIDEQDFMKSLQATFKLGIEFKNWGLKGDSYIHSFGQTGKDCWACEFQHFWLAGKAAGVAEDFGDYCVELQAAKAGKLLGSDKSNVNYAYHLDAGLYAGYLKKIALKYGTQHIDGKIENVVVNPENGFIKSLALDNGQTIDGDLFIDCTGFSARLIEGALNVQYEPYGHYLPCDSAVAIQTEKFANLRPYTQAIAHDAGWQWRIPLQHRVGNGLVYSSRFMSDEEAQSTLRNNLESNPITEPRMFRYKTGRRIKAWHKNCVSIGLASGFLEPVESTSIHLALSGILRLLKLFPHKEINQHNVDEYNDQTKHEMEYIRDFIIMHYHATEREDTAFWRYCKNMEVPETLSHRMKLFEETAAFPIKEKELFKIDSWMQVLLGQRVKPKQYHPIVNLMGKQDLDLFLSTIKREVDKKVAVMPSHQEFINQYCPADNLM